MTTTDPQTGERCRGFHVHVRAPKTRFRKRAATLRYPASGCAPFTGAQAIDCMEKLLTRGFVSSAYTSGHGIEETLTLEEMKEVVL